MENLEYFKKCAADGLPVKVTFHQIDRERAQFVARGDGFTVVMPVREIVIVKKNTEESIWNTPLIGKHLGEELELFVMEIDEEKGIVTCGRENIKLQRRRDEKKKIDEVLAKGDGSTYIVKGRVIGIYGEGSRSRALLLTETGIRLLLFCKRWSFDYIEDIKDVTKVGDELEVAIYDHNNTNDNVDYLVSRMDLLPNPWVGIEEVVHPGDIVVVRVLSRRRGVFNTRIEGIDGIVALATFPDNRKLRIAMGGRYQCEVVTVCGATHTLVVKPFAEKR